MKRIILLSIIVSAIALAQLFAQDIQVKPNTSVTIQSTTTMNVSTGNLVLQSDASGDASLIDYGTLSYSGSGETKVQRYLTESQWHIISSPISDAVSGMFTDDYLYYHTENDDQWNNIIATDYNLAVMHGYLVWSSSPAPTTEVFSGTTNTGSTSFNFTQNGPGYNLIGNPYPSVLDWDAVTIPAELSGAI